MMTNLSRILLIGIASTSENTETFSLQLHLGLFSCRADRELLGIMLVSESVKGRGHAESDVSKEFLCAKGLENVSYN